LSNAHFSRYWHKHLHVCVWLYRTLLRRSNVRGCGFCFGYIVVLRVCLCCVYMYEEARNGLDWSNRDRVGNSDRVCVLLLGDRDCGWEVQGEDEQANGEDRRGKCHHQADPSYDRDPRGGHPTVHRPSSLASVLPSSRYVSLPPPPPHFSLSLSLCVCVYLFLLLKFVLEFVPIF